MKGPNHGSWRGDNVSYATAHLRVRQARGAASEQSCIDCGYPARDWSYRGGAPGERTWTVTRNGKEREYEYSTDPAYYDPRCRSCHISYDWGKKYLTDTDETYAV